MAMKGMDIEAGRQSAQTIAQGASQLEQLTAQLTNSLTQFEWIGPDADRTRQTWESEHRTHLTNIVSALNDFSTLINQEAQSQESVSN
jgi:uncharacterized phage infection (PIP) family protein YhgE